MNKRLDLLRKIAEAIDYAHRQRIFHGALSPMSVLIEQPGSDTPEPKVFNWQISFGETGATSAALTSSVESWLEPLEQLYLAPETFHDPGKAGASVDVFSLGAVGYHLICLRPPASSPDDLRKLLREQEGLRLEPHQQGYTPELAA